MEYSRGTEFKINKYSNYNVAFGAMNKNKPKSLYIKISAWANPESNSNENYRHVIKKITKRVKTHLYNNTNANKFDINKTMIDLDMRESGINYGKSSFMSCEITMYLDVNIVANSDIMKENLNYMIPTILKDVFENNKTFKFNKKK